jgi:4'-phosphopantetheinyl transferase
MVHGLTSDVVQVWTATTDDVPGPAWESCNHWLDTSERERRQRLQVDADRVAFVAAHALLHWALDQVGVPPQRHQFVHNPFGRPQLVQGPGRTEPMPGFSMSHARGLVAVALGPGPLVGIDVERVAVRRVDPLALARRCFDSGAAAWIAAAAADPALCRQRFFQVWTLKEALVKAVGLGLSLPLDSFAVQADAPHAVTGAPALRPAGRWRIEQWSPDAGSWAALAVDEPAGRPLQVLRRHLDGPALLALLQSD